MDTTPCDLIHYNQSGARTCLSGVTAQGGQNITVKGLLTEMTRCFEISFRQLDTDELDT